MKLRPFELALVIGSAVLGLFALFILATYTPPENVPEGVTLIQGNVLIWGFLPREAVSPILENLKQTNPSYGSVSYQFIEPSSFDSQLLNALADGRGPDLVLIPHERLVQLQRRLRPFSYETFPQPDFRNIYLDGSGIFAFPEGLYAIPLAVDPLVMYWNRDLLFNAQLLNPPTSWEELISVHFPKLIQRSDDLTIKRAVVSFGGTSNVRNGFAAISALLLQGGSELVTPKGSSYEVNLSRGQGNPLLSAMNFYIGFSNPRNARYSWNRSITDDRSMFLRGDLVFYFGFASEAKRLAELNPNLNFDVAELPQGASATLRRTYGTFYGVGLMDTSRNRVSAQNVALDMANFKSSLTIADNVGMVPAIRAHVIAGSNELYKRTAYKAAPVAYGWLNPRYQTVTGIINSTIEDITANRDTSNQAVRDMEGRIQLAY